MTSFRRCHILLFVCWLVGCLTSQQQASVSQGRICSHNFTCCHTEIEVADPTFYLTQSQYTDTGPTSPSADPTTPGAWQGSHWSANFEVTGMTRPRKNHWYDSNPGSSALEVDALPLGQRGGLPHTKPENSNHKTRLERTGGRLGEQTCHPLHHVSKQTEWNQAGSNKA